MRELNMLPLDFRLAIGDTPRLITINKFGRNPDVSTSKEDIWFYGGTETLMTTAAPIHISSSAATTALLKIEGLDENWDIFTESKALAGQTETAVSANNWLRVHRAYVVDASAAPTGDVYIYEDDTVTGGVPQTGSKVHARLDFAGAAINQTEKAAFTVPRNYKGVITDLWASMRAPTGTARSCQVTLETQQLAEGATSDNPSWAPFRSRFGLTVSTTTSESARSFRYPIVVPELTNIVMRGVSTSSSAIEAQFTMILVPTT